MRVSEADGRLSDPIEGTPTVFAEGQGELLHVALDCDFARTRLVYLSFADPGANLTAVRRGVKNLMFIAAAAALLATPALAQNPGAAAADSHNRAQGNPTHLGGTNQRADGPAERTHELGGMGRTIAPGTVTVPRTTGTVVPGAVGSRVPGSATADSHTRTQGNQPHTVGARVPAYQQGDNQMSGGPANEPSRRL